MLFPHSKTCLWRDPQDQTEVMIYHHFGYFFSLWIFLSPFGLILKAFYLVFWGRFSDWPGDQLHVPSQCWDHQHVPLCQMIVYSFGRQACITSTFDWTLSLILWFLVLIYKINFRNVIKKQKQNPNISKIQYSMKDLFTSVSCFIIEVMLGTVAWTWALFHLALYNR